MKLILFFLVLFFLTPAVLQAEEMSDTTTREISHLLDYVELSGCLFIRNGTSHDSPTARKHINKKFQHIRTRVSNAEDFITYAASKSSITGARYQVKCGDATMDSEGWLTRELERYRDSR